MDREWMSAQNCEAVAAQGTGSRSKQTLGQKSKLESAGAIYELKLLLVGKSRSGKSTTGNTILGKTVFKSQFSEQPVTVKCQLGKATLGKREVVVIDTPDLFSSTISAEDRQQNLEHCLELCAHSIHALLVVIPIGHFKAEDRNTIKGILEVFGDQTRKCIIVFTRKDELEDDTLQDFIDSNQDLKEFVRICGDRFCAFNNKAPEERDVQVSELLELLDKIKSRVDENGGSHCLELSPSDSEWQACMSESPPQNGISLHETLNIVIVGRSGPGKSATGNTILGGRFFLSQLSARSVTKTCQGKSRIWGTQKVVVVDTPSLTLVPGDVTQLEEEIRRCSSYCQEGNTVMVLVFQLGRFTQIDEKAFLDLEAIFGKKVKDYMIVLFTRREDLEEETIEEYVRNTDNKALKKIVEECGMRVCAFNNRETGQDAESQVKTLLTMATDLISRNGGKGYPLTWENVSQTIKTAQESSKSTFTKFFKGWIPGFE